MFDEHNFDPEPDFLPNISEPESIGSDKLIPKKPLSHYSLLIINREESERLLFENKDKTVYILRYKKLDEFMTPDSVGVLSYYMYNYNKIKHIILTESNYIQSIDFLENSGYYKLII